MQKYCQFTTQPTKDPNFFLGYLYYNITLNTAMCFGPQGTFIKELNRSNIAWNKMHGMKYIKDTIVFFSWLLEAIKIWDRNFGLSAENWTRDLLDTNQQPIMNR